MGTGATTAFLLGVVLFSAELPPTMARGLDRTGLSSSSSRAGYCRQLPMPRGVPGGGGGCHKCNRDADCPPKKKCCGSQCGNTCQMPEPNRCKLPAETGPCKAYMLMFFYNWQAKKCERFIYGGCYGNLNRFATVKECQLACGGQDTVIPAWAEGPVPGAAALGSNPE